MSRKLDFYYGESGGYSLVARHGVLTVVKVPKTGGGKHY